ncbi:MAG: hypothetical protein IT349_20395 [Candidatus Eisenbacteria bacterium]|nr:hypothetical protein [Candidatus Eisenbacteria bacterium]MCC7144464.1 hypothetical protein [Candidatus Eisenbacteria bacterium]
MSQGDPICPRCDQPFALEAFLAAVSGYSTVTDSGGSVCPACNDGMEFRVGNGSLELGYTYWSGSLHFEGVKVFKIASLRRGTDAGAVYAEYAEKRYLLSPPPASPD